jgi:hypothetical protein
MTAFAATLARSPELFPHALDPKTGAVSLIRLTEADYRAASFLDGRVLTPQTISRVIAWPEIEQAVAGLPEACDFIFHIGHVGSTLLSRLLGAHPKILPVREPAILRTLADSRSTWSADTFETRTSAFLKLWSRTFAKDQRAVVKATSIASELASDLLARDYAPKAIFMAVSPETYLATIFGGPNSRAETKVLAQARYTRLNRRIGRPAVQPATLSEGEFIAVSWACEMTALHAAHVRAQDRVMLVDFDKFLAEPAPLLLAAFKHLGIDASAADVAAILAGPDMSRYSKAPEYSYDSKLRSDVLNQARAQHAGEIARGLNWLDRLSDASPMLRDARAYSPI